MGFLIIDSSLPLYKVLINVKRMNNAQCFSFYIFFQVNKNNSSVKNRDKGPPMDSIRPWIGEEQIYTNILVSPPPPIPFPQFNSIPKCHVAYLSSFCCVSSSSVFQTSSAFPCLCDFALGAVLLNKRSRWLAPPRRTSLGRCPTASLYQGLRSPLPSLLTLPGEPCHREQMEARPHPGSAGCPAPVPACSSPSHSLGVRCPAPLRQTH